jgi:glycosyltransferase 2 family protein
MQESLPLSWTRIEGIRPRYKRIWLPLNRLHWISFADVPHHYSFQILYDDISRTCPEGFVLRGCPPAMVRFLKEMNCCHLRTGAEAVLNLSKPHMKRKTVASSLVRGKKQGYIEEVVLNDLNRQILNDFRTKTSHADKPQLMNLFRDEPGLSCRLFVFKNFTGSWLAAMTLSKRGMHEMHTELMLRQKDAPGDIMECLMAEIFGMLESEGILEWSLGEVPFVLPGEITDFPPDATESLMLSLASSSRHAYDYESLYRFKNKFAPEWRPVNLCSNKPPSVLMLGELAVLMGYGNLLVHQSFSVLKKLFIPF